MMYKIMGLNSILSAFAMSALTLDGVKLGDGQTAMESLFTSMCFFLVSRSTPAKQLAKQQPISSVFAWPVMATLACQLLGYRRGVAVPGVLWLADGQPMAFQGDLEGEFEPNLTNTDTRLQKTTQHAASFLANYDGHPFMQPLSVNRPLMYSLVLFVTAIIACASEVTPDLNHSLSLVLSPNEDSMGDGHSAGFLKYKPS
ncbi:SPF1 [Symbiodinium pilosum]|uniref:SPF1 protein n=1 Tax=Symbiodinium pilosum TaxID=2952 RepID=A0A812IV69_SYMPI|nr:SPF1 [Symbiodinium pilosum]